MTNKEFVKLRSPKAMAERQKAHDKTVYWLVRENRNTMYIGSGDTEAQAWKAAREVVKDRPIAVKVEGGKLVVKSSIPCLTVQVWNGHFEIVKEQVIPGGGAGVMPYFKHGQDPVKETIGELTMDLPKGLYSVRFTLPYYNNGSLFPMPVMMDKHITVYDDSVVTLEFSPKLYDSIKKN